MHRFSRRWLLVVAGGLGLIGLGELPRPLGAAADESPDALRARLLASAGRPYTGYARSNGRLGLPELPELGQVTALLSGTTRIRAFVAGPDRWRVDELGLAGERDTYRLGEAEYIWDFGANQLVRVVGRTPVRLPRAADLLPPELARRLLGLSAADPVTALPPRRVAGHTALGLRVVPGDPDTTVGRVDVWAEPATALPLRVEIAGRDAVDPVLRTELRDVDLSAPTDDLLRPRLPPGAGAIEVRAADLTGALRVLDAGEAPPRLAGRARVTLSDQLPGVGFYGTGLASFALIPLGRDVARPALDGAGAAGGDAVELPVGRGVALATPLLSLLVRGGVRGGGALLIGTVRPDVLLRAAVELPVRDPR